VRIKCGKRGWGVDINGIQGVRGSSPLSSTNPFNGLAAPPSFTHAKLTQIGLLQAGQMGLPMPLFLLSWKIQALDELGGG